MTEHNHTDEYERQLCIARGKHFKPGSMSTANLRENSDDV